MKTDGWEVKSATRAKIKNLKTTRLSSVEPDLISRELVKRCIQTQTLVGDSYHDVLLGICLHKRDAQKASEAVELDLCTTAFSPVRLVVELSSRSPRSKHATTEVSP